MARHRRPRWGLGDWLQWLGVCVLIYAAALTGYTITTTAAGRPWNIGPFSAWFAGGLALAGLIVAARQVCRGGH
jgi:hypothetical protein